MAWSKMFGFNVRQLYKNTLILAAILSHINFFPDMDEEMPEVAQARGDVAADQAGRGTAAVHVPPPPPIALGRIPVIKKSDLGPVYQQCSKARTAGTKISITEFSGGNCTVLATALPTIGSLDSPDSDNDTKTFHGGRVNKNGRTVNECITISFDPRNLHCVSCEKPHHILGSNKPPVLIFSDQNFVPSAAK
jgi:hypothetical protein